MNTPRIRLLTRLVPAFLLASAGSAFAGDPACHAETAAKHHADHATAAAHHAALQSLAELSLIPVRADDTSSDHAWSDGKNEVKIVRKDGKVRVTLNGEEIMTLDDADLFHNEIGGAHEQAQNAQELARTMRNRVRRGMAPMAPMPPMPPGAPRSLYFRGDAPKVMIGVTMETAEEAQAKVPEGVDSEKATVITRVVEGLPAEKGGLEEGDIVIQVNGTNSAAPDDIREAIKEKKAGDELKLRVVRAGVEKDIVIALAQYDGEKLGSPMAWGFSDDSDAAAPEPMSDAELKALDQLRANMDKASAELEKAGAALANAKSDEEREKLTERMAELGSELAELGSEMGELTGHDSHWNFLGSGENNFDIQRLPRMRIERGNGPPRAFLFSPEGAQSQPGEPDRIQKLDERLERLEKLLEKVVEEKEKSKN